MAYRINENCLTCGICQPKCPSGAIVPEGFNLRIDENACTECGVCYDICRLEGIDNGSAPEPPTAHEPRTLKCDLAVIGAGGAGLVAAVKVGQTGKKVIVLEKAKYPGGCAYYASGWHIIGSKLNEEAGMPDTRDEMVRDAVKQTHYALDPRLIGKCIYALGPFFDWMCGFDGFKENFIVSDSPFGGASISYSPIESRRPDGKPRPGRYVAGKFVMETLIDQCNKLGVEILTEHRATELLVSNGAISGVVTEDPGGKTTIECDSILLATGNWISNDELCERFIPNFHHNRPGQKSPHMLPSATGDGIKLAEDVGGLIDYDNFAARIFGPHIMPASAGIELFASRPEIIYVNLDGNRWVNEDKSEMEGGVALMNQPGCRTWAVFDEGMLDEMGRRVQSGFGGGDPMLMRFKPAPGAKQRIDEAIIAPDVPHIKANTLEELSEKTGLPLDSLMATIKRYNKLCEAGFDSDYFKPSKYLVPFTDGPYYAVVGMSVSDGAFGGVLIDSDTRALDKNKKPIPGLYAAGDNCCGWLVNLAGDKKSIINDLTWAFASGYMAAEAIVG